MTMKSALVPLFLALLTSCVHNLDRLKTELDPLVGKHPDTVVEQWGAPDSTYAMESGKKVLTYTSERQVNRYNNYGYSAYRLGNYSYSESCKINFYTDEGGKKIDRWTSNGDSSSCVEMLKDMRDTMR